VVLGGIAVLAGLVGAGLHAANASAGRVTEPSFWLMGLAAALAYGTASLVLRLPEAVWLRYLMGGIGLLLGISLVSLEWSLMIPDTTVGSWTAWLGSWVWAPAYVAVATVLPLLLPDGSLPSMRWRPALWLALLAVAVPGVVWALTPYELQDFPQALEGWTNPVGVAAVASAPWSLLGDIVLVAAVAVAVASLVIRWRRAQEVERQQLKWVLLGVAVTVLLFGVGRFLPAEVTGVVAGLAMLPLPLAIGVAVLRHGLWDVDVVISRSLLYVALAGVVATVYVVVVVLLGDSLGGGTEAQVVATTVIALLVLPLHSWLRNGVNRLVHGGAEEPYAVLARLGDRLGAATSPDDLAEHVLPSVVEQVARALRARRVGLTLRDGSVTTWGVAADASAEAMELALEYAGESLGTLSAWRPGGLGWNERRVMERLARQASVAAHTVLLAREARRAREAVVLAREEERRRLRRDLHDGVGPSLAALALHVETARDLAAEDPTAATALLDRLVPRINATVADVRAVVHELRPPMLDELGLGAAVREVALSMSSARTRVHSSSGDLGELPAAVEVAAFRIAGEAIANAIRHSGASQVDVHLARTNGLLCVEVSDNGSGVPVAATQGVGTESMSARAEELGGHLDIRSGVQGTCVTAILPSEVP
jgi:signal transduction histidine kinase